MYPLGRTLYIGHNFGRDTIKKLGGTLLLKSSDLMLERFDRGQRSGIELGLKTHRGAIGGVQTLQ